MNAAKMMTSNRPLRYAALSSKPSRKSKNNGHAGTSLMTGLFLIPALVIVLAFRFLKWAVTVQV